MSEKNRKKSDVIKQKNKLKVTEGFKLLVYARWISLFTALLVLVLFFLNTGFTTENMQEIMRENPILTVGFLICMIDLFIWYQLNTLIQYITNLNNIETVRIQLLIIAIVQLIGFNYLSFFCVVLALVRYFRWDGFSIKASVMEIKKENQLKNTLVLALVLIPLSLLAMLMSYLLQSV